MEYLCGVRLFLDLRDCGDMDDEREEGYGQESVMKDLNLGDNWSC